MCCSIAWPKSTTCGINISLAPQPQEIPFFWWICCAQAQGCEQEQCCSWVMSGLVSVPASPGALGESKPFCSHQLLHLLQRHPGPWGTAQPRQGFSGVRVDILLLALCIVLALPYFFNKIASVCCFNIIYLPVLKLTFSYSSLNALHQNSAWLTLMCFSELWEKCGGKSLTKR